MALTNTPDVLGDDIIRIMAGTNTNEMPTDFTGSVEIQECVNKMPQFFPDRENIEYKVLASKQSRNLLGARASIDGTVSAYYEKMLYDAHVQMLEWQTDEDGAGCFWLIWYIESEERTVAVRCKVDDKIKTPEDEAGALNLKEIQITNVDEAIEEQGNVFADLTKIDAPTVTATGSDLTITRATGAVSYEVYEVSEDKYTFVGSVVQPESGNVDFVVSGAGDYVVKAIGDGGTYSNSDYSEAVTVA